MKKYLVLCAALMVFCCLPLRSQDSDTNGFSVDLSVIPVFEGVVSMPMDKGIGAGSTFDLGNSNLYTLIDAQIFKGLSFSSEIHWMGVGLSDGHFDSSYITDLYSNVGRSDTANFLDWAYLDWNIGNFDLILGKNSILIGSTELEVDDWDAHPSLFSSFWNNLAFFQWGGELDYTTNSGNTTFGLQVCTSPYGDYPFKSKRYSFGAKWTGNYGPLHTNWAVSDISTVDGSYFNLVSLGQRVSFSNSFALSLDYFNAICDPYIIFRKGTTVYASALWNPSEKWEVNLRAGIEKETGKEKANYLSGLALHYFVNEDLRLHFTFAANSMLQDIDRYYATIGIRYMLNFHIGK